MTICIKMLICIFITILSVTSCGGGGGGGVGTPAVSYGALDGYVYVPYGSGRVVFADTAPSGYKPLSGATVTATLNQSEKSTTTSSTGYFKISSLKTGTYAVSVSKTGYGKYQTSAVVKANETKSVGGGEISMLPSSRGSITVSANISGGTVLLDGENTGLSIPAGLSRTFENISTGSHSVGLSQAGYEGGDSKNVVVGAGGFVGTEFFMMPSGNRAPSASIATDGKGFVGFEYMLDGSSSSDPDGDSLTYAWEQISGPSAALSATTESMAKITPSASDTYRFRITVSDGYLNDSEVVDFSAMKLTGRIVGTYVASQNSVYILAADGSTFTNVTLGIQPSWSSNGEKIIFAGIFEINDDGTGKREIISNGGEPIYSSDGQTILYVKGNSIYTANIDGTNEVLLVDPGSNYTGELSLSPDGNTIAFSGEFGTWNSEIMLINLDGSEYVRLSNNNLSDTNPTWLQDDRILFGSAYQSPDSQLYLMDGDGGNITKLCNDNVFRGYHIVSSDESVIFYSDDIKNKVYAMYLDCKGTTEILSGYKFFPGMHTPYE